jgi:2-polyprenyl-6-methoxyphenol hydroxylase-like FAD-dependent oxidoreductase
MNPVPSHAVVVGASMTGLLAARVLADFYGRVTVLDRDCLPNGPDARKGVPQGHQIHVLLVGGANVLETLFPGFFVDLVRQGSVPVDFSSSEASWFQQGIWKTQAARQILVHCQTRPFLEWHLRSRVLGLPRVTLRPSSTVTRLAWDDSHSRVTGVFTRSADPANPGDEQFLDADLVVDAGGRNSSTPKWLGEAGYAQPRETTVAIKMGYSTRFYQCPASGHPPWKALAVYANAPLSTRSGVIFRVEGDRYIVTLMGALGDYPPTDDAGFLEFARQLDNPALHDWLQHAQPLTPAVPYRYPAHLRRHYAEQDRFPDGLLVCGDALCSFNPIYGQGMTAGALEVLALRDALQSQRQTGTPLWRSFFTRADKAVHGPWTMATGADFLHPRTEGERPWDTPLRNWYLRRLLAATGRDPEVTSAFYEVLHVLKKPSALFTPDILARVLFGRSTQ